MNTICAFSHLQNYLNGIRTLDITTQELCRIGNELFLYKKCYNSSLVVWGKGDCLNIKSPSGCMSNMGRVGWKGLGVESV